MLTEPEPSFLIEIRILLDKAIKDEKSCESLSILLEEIQHPSALLLGFKGANMAIKASYYANPISKLSLVKKAYEVLDHAVDKDPKDVEIRFLRYSVQKNVPSILMLKNDQKSDIEAIIKYISDFKNQDKPFKTLHIIASDIIATGKISKDDQKKLDRYVIR